MVKLYNLDQNNIGVLGTTHHAPPYIKYASLDQVQQAYNMLNITNITITFWYHWDAHTYKPQNTSHLYMTIDIVTPCIPSYFNFGVFYL